MIDKPMNPYAAEDFANAIKEAMKEAVIEVEHRIKMDTAEEVMEWWID